MNNFKPGEFRITDRAMKIWNLQKGAEILDIGCGQGETVEYIGKEYGYKASGIDLSEEMINQGLAKNPELDIKHGDGEFLDDFPSYSFDGIMMECVLSLINLPDEALHEMYCVLKKGGKLFISDLYIKNPDQDFIKALAIEAERQKKIPFTTGSCSGNHEHDSENCSEEDHSSIEYDEAMAQELKKRVISFRHSGRFLIEPLIDLLKEIGYTQIAWEDCSNELDTFVAETIMRDGTLESCFCGECLKPQDDYKTGYFMLTAVKPAI